jgi:hypothetical protein
VYHGHGHLEKVYENALAHRLCKTGLDIKQQHPIKVYDEDGTLIGDYLADLLVAGEWSEAEFQRHTQPLCAFTQQVRSWHFRRFVLNDLPACRTVFWPE